MSKDENVDKLLNAVLFGTPDEARRVLKSSGGIEYTGRALGAACRFRGLDMVKALVESGAKFTHDYGWHNTDMVFEFEDGYNFVKTGRYGFRYSLIMLSGVRFRYFARNSGVRTWTEHTKEDDELVNREPLPASEIIRSLEYLCDNAKQSWFVPEWLLYYAILFCDDEIYTALKKLGVSGFPRELSVSAAFSDERDNFSAAFQRLSLNKVSVMMERLKKELDGKKIAFSDNLYERRQSQLLAPDIWRLSLEVFDRKHMNQMRLMKLFINNAAAGCLKICEEYGWLRNPKKRDKLLDYASKHGSAECTAYLLELKNSAGDISDGLDELDLMFDFDFDEPPEDPKKVWNYIKRRDGTLCITGYKGSRTELDVPERIGKLIVTAIGDDAFSCVKLQMSTEEKELRQSVTKVTLPQTIQVVGKQAFCGCAALTEVNIPGSVTDIGKNAFGGCTNLTLQIPRSSYAEDYCVKNKVNHIFTEVENL